MRNLLTILASCVCLSCAAADSRADDDLQELRRISRDFLMAFEPQNVPADAMVDRALKHFEQGPDFTRTVDATFYPSFDSLSRNVRRWAEAMRRGEWDTHIDIEIIDERALLLDSNAGVVTQTYRERGTDQEGRQWQMPFAAITYVFARRGGVWKIVYYHGSHGPRSYGDSGA